MHALTYYRQPLHPSLLPLSGPDMTDYAQNTDTRTHLDLSRGASRNLSQQVTQFLSTHALHNTSFPHFSWDFILSLGSKIHALSRIGSEVYFRALLASLVNQLPDTTAHELSVRRLLYYPSSQTYNPCPVGYPRVLRRRTGLSSRRRLAPLCQQ